MNERQENEARRAYRAAAIEEFGEEAVQSVYDLITAVTNSADATRVSGEFYGQSRHGRMIVKPLSGKAGLLNGTTRESIGGHRGVMAVLRNGRLVGFTWALSNSNSEHLMFSAATPATRRLWHKAAPVLKKYGISYKPDGALIPHNSRMH